jgi:hypothetical protein
MIVKKVYDEKAQILGQNLLYSKKSIATNQIL